MADFRFLLRKPGPSPASQPEPGAIKITDVRVRAGSGQRSGAPSERWRPRNPSLRFLFRLAGPSHPLCPTGAARGRPGRSTAASRAQGRESGRILHLPPGPPEPSRRAMERAYAASCRAASAPVWATAASSAAAPAAPRRRTKGLKGGGDRDGGRGLGTSGSWSPALRRGKASDRTKKDDARHCARPGPTAPPRGRRRRVK